MPQTLDVSKFIPLEDDAPNKSPLTRSHINFLVRNGFLSGRYEIIDGNVISKMGQRPPHAKCITRLTRYLVAAFGADFVRIQLPVDVSDEDNERNEPEPDGVATARGVDELPDDRNPGPADCVLIVEVSDATARFDLTRKARLYARAGFPEYWVLDLNERRLLVHRAPQVSGEAGNSGDAAYSDIAAYDENETAAPLSAPNALVRVADLLPSPDADMVATTN